MRKILAALLAVLTVVSLLAVLPASAETTARKSEFDGTWSNQTFDLIVTEYSRNTTITNATNSSVSTDADCYQFIELYNNGANPINLYEISILHMSDSVGSASSVWRQQKNFKETGLQLKLGPGSIYDSVDGMTTGKKDEQATNYASVENPTSAMLFPGEVAVIWFWNKDSATVSKQQKESLATDVDGRAKFSKFRDHYAAVSNISKFEADGETITDAWQNLEDTLIVAVCANTSVNSKLFDLTTYGSMFAIANKNFQLEANVDKGGNHIYCYFSSSINGRHGISSLSPDLTTIYVPPMCTPDLYNAIAKMESETPENIVDAVDYLEWSPNNQYGVKGAGTSLSYLELGMMSFQELPSVGAMSSYQWMYIAPERMEELVEEENFGLIADWNDEVMAGIKKTEGNAVTLQDNWTEICLQAMLDSKVQEPEKEVDRTETEREEDSMLRDQNFWEEQKGSNTQQNNDDDGGLSPLVLVLIIVGGVVVLAGAAVAVILILKKKNKPVALDDVASEEAVEVIDEQAEEKTEE